MHVVTVRRLTIFTPAFVEPSRLFVNHFSPLLSKSRIQEYVYQCPYTAPTTVVRPSPIP